MGFLDWLRKVLEIGPKNEPAPDNTSDPIPHPDSQAVELGNTETAGSAIPDLPTISESSDGEDRDLVTDPSCEEYDNLVGANLAGADLYGANMKGADLSGADLTDTDLTHWYLTDANLSGAYLIHCDLTGANLTDTYVSGVDLTDVIGADFTGAILE